jgi:uncharacterized protein with von Willebrand factor type A (vWA) domain
MSETTAPHYEGRIAENIMHFARVLRRAGLPIGPNRIIDAVKAVEVAGVTRREDFYWTMASVFIDKREQFELFDQAFQVFWRNPKLLERALSLLMPENILPATDGSEAVANDRLSNRLADATKSDIEAPEEEGEAPPDEIKADAAFSSSAQEILSQVDFESMSQAEMAEAKRLIARLRLPIPEITTRRFRPDERGRRIDLRMTLRAGMRTGGDVIPLKRRSPRKRHPPLVVLCDVSGSMSRYSRMFLHFLHAITSDRDRVTSFVFGTRLTNITRHLKHRDVDIAMTQVMEMINDWSGGTRIGQCLTEFNLRWSRRVLAQNATILLISDGLDGDVGAGLGSEMERMHKSCRSLIWLNPLLRYDGFEARPAGIRAMLPHVDAFLPAHNIKSLIELAAVMNAPPERMPRRKAA